MAGYGCVDARLWRGVLVVVMALSVAACWASAVEVIGGRGTSTAGRADGHGSRCGGVLSQ